MGRYDIDKSLTPGKHIKYKHQTFQSKFNGAPKTVTEQICVPVTLGELWISEDHDTAVSEVLLKMNTFLEFVHFIPQGIDVSHNHRGQKSH